MAQNLNELLRSKITSKDQPFTGTDIANSYREAYGRDISQEELRSATDIRAKIRSEFNTPTPTIPKPMVSPTSEEKIVSGTDDIRGAEQEVKYDGQDMLGRLDSVQLLTDKTREDSMMNLSKLLEQSKILTDMDLQRIEAAGNTAGTMFNAPIERAREAARQGLAKATVGSGERGGFMNTQYAGQAALTEIEGGNFVGRGGELSRIKGELDSNITALESARINAIQTAREAARAAIMSGKRQDLDDAKTLAQMAIQAAEAKEMAVSKRIDVISQLDSLSRERVEFSQGQEDRSMKKLQELAELGTDIPAEFAKDIESRYGVGFVEDYLTATNLAKQADNEKAQLDAFDKVTQILARVPEGTSIKIGDATYKGYKESDPNTRTFSEEDASGNVTYITLDESTGEIIAKASGGRIGKGRASSGGSVSSDGKMTDDFKAWYFETFKESVSDNPEAAQSEWERWKTTGASKRKPVEYTATQKLKLEAKGLLNAPREEQLKALFEDDSSENVY